MALNLLCRVVRRRVERGELLDTVLMDYPRLTEEERVLVREKVKGICNVQPA